MKGALSLVRFLSDATARGERSALVTITDVIGQSARSPGTHMAITESGAYHGSLSGGCVEAAVVGEALRIIASGSPECLRLGVGSPYIDIRLPCGGGLDLLIVPDPAQESIETARRMLERRIPVALVIGRDGSLATEQLGATGTGWHGDEFVARHHPDLRLMIVGHGTETDALARLASAYGAEVAVFSPDADIIARLADSGMSAALLKTPARSDLLSTDAFTAVVMLFHDHDWELDLMGQALEQEALFIGAMGSRSTQARRLDALRSRGLSDAMLARLHGPIGLIPATRDPDTLALSVLSQVVELYQSQILAAP
ncbi:XdhC family protein [Novosphingobium naphthalenivorans]|uniref:XdhC family protein n=1 Tax=Novosphingobium naphthalenivorans TaxID=273168 RepID=UPI000A014819|nr:XdhC family protein [Novosphingobium naphthalenivorans]